MTKSDCPKIEAVLLKYIERFGLIPAAKDYYQNRPAGDGKQRMLSPQEAAICEERFGYLPD